MFVSCVHPVVVLNAAFCMTCSLLMLVFFCLPHHVTMSVFITCSDHGCVAMGRAVLFILRSRLVLYSAGSGVKNEKSASCFVWI